MSLLFVFFLFNISVFSSGGMALLPTSQLTATDKKNISQSIINQITNSRYTDKINQYRDNINMSVSFKDESNIRMIINLPTKNRIHALIRYRKNSFITLKKFVFSPQENMSIRWKALTSLARVYPDKSYGTIKKALNSSEWFLRNAGLIALEIISPQDSLKKANDFLNDPSLIVRTAAVDLIKKYKAIQFKIYLIQKLHAPDSYYKNSSLWIRSHIVSTLADFATPGEEKMFISLLQDPDQRLHKYSILALENITGKTFYTTDVQKADNQKNITYKNLQIQKQQWISWWAQDYRNKKSIEL